MLIPTRDFPQSMYLLADDGHGHRAWMSAPLASASRVEGGLQLPNLREELLLMSAAAVSRWLSAHDSVLAAVGQTLLGDQNGPPTASLAPARAMATAPRIYSTITMSGRSVLRAAASQSRDVDEVRALAPLLPHAGRAPVSAGSWQDGWYCRDYSRHATALSAVARLQRTRYGPLNHASLLGTHLLGTDLLLCEPTRVVTAADLPGLACSGARVGDLLDFQRTGPHSVRFRLRGVEYPYAAARSFRLLCDLLVFNYPDLLLPTPASSALVERSSSPDTWSVCHSASGVRLLRDRPACPTEDLGVVQSLSHAQAVARKATGRRRVYFAPHPLLCAALPLWGSAERFGKRRLRALLASASTQKVQAEQEARSHRLESQAPEFAAALARVSWLDVFNLPDSSSRQRLLFLKVKGSRVSGWDVAAGRRGCPHCTTTGSDGGSVYHIVWECPAARRLWQAIRARWVRLGLWTRLGADCERDFLSAIFSLRLPCTPPKVWDLASLSQRPTTDDAPEGPFPILQAVWQQLVLETLVIILGWRFSCFDPSRTWSESQALAIHAASCRRILGTLALRRTRDPQEPSVNAQLVTELRDLFDHVTPDPEPAVLTSPAATDMHILFFDGGSRGNPGPGGSGACIVRVSRLGGDAAVVWSAAMSHAHRSTTNNQAEYHGLLVGLRAARAHRWPNLEVVGDSALILRQLHDYRPPKNPRLLRLYSQARRLADHLGIRHWHHHLRAHNKMADALANLAMDTRTSSQVLHPTARSGHASLHDHLSNDLRPWLADSVDRRAGFSVSS